MKKVLITRKIPETGIKILEQKCNVEVNPYNRELKKIELINRIKDKNGLISLLSDKIDREIIDAGKKLEVIANYAVGYDNIDVKYATKKGIVVTNTPDVLTESTAHLAIGLMLAITRRIPEGDKLVRDGEFTGWSPEFFLGTELSGKTLGIIGFGRIGKLVAKLALCFSMKVIYYSRGRYHDFEKEFDIKYTEFKELLKQSDFISLHVPLTKDTKHLIGNNEIELMKNTVYIINTSRGDVIDEKSLIDALKRNRIKGAALDVYSNEPNINPEFFKLKNTVLLPHIGSATVETRIRMAELAAKSIIDVFDGKTPKNIVNPVVLNSKRQQSVQS